MIGSATQLKAKVKNLAGGDERKSKAYIRIFFMERFLERVAISKYKERFVLKGGLLVSSLLGYDMRATMDIDTSVTALPLTLEDISRISTEISEIPIDDNVSFIITKIETIMDDFEYPGIRVHLEGNLGKLRQPIKIDISTDDVITPGAVEYEYQLLFENRTLRLYSYNIETLLAEKTQTIINRGLANTRMRDFYDLYELAQHKDFSWELYRKAFDNTCAKRKTLFSEDKIETELQLMIDSEPLKNLWMSFTKKNYFAGNINYEQMLTAISETIRKMQE